jgi:hypothetical protein
LTDGCRMLYSKYLLIYKFSIIVYEMC